MDYMVLVRLQRQTPLKSQNAGIYLVNNDMEESYFQVIHCLLCESLSVSLSSVFLCLSLSVSLSLMIKNAFVTSTDFFNKFKICSVFMCFFSLSFFPQVARGEHATIGRVKQTTEGKPRLHS